MEFCIGALILLVLVLVGVYFVIYIVYRLIYAFQSTSRTDTQVGQSEGRDERG